MKRRSQRQLMHSHFLQHNAKVPSCAKSGLLFDPSACYKHKRA